MFVPILLAACFGDAQGRLTSSMTNIGGTPRTLIYAYDLNGNRMRLTFVAGRRGCGGGAVSL
jgi:hypothetical protein